MLGGLSGLIPPQSILHCVSWVDENNYRPSDYDINFDHHALLRLGPHIPDESKSSLFLLIFCLSAVAFPAFSLHGWCRAPRIARRRCGSVTDFTCNDAMSPENPVETSLQLLDKFQWTFLGPTAKKKLLHDGVNFLSVTSATVTRQTLQVTGRWCYSH